MPSFALDFSLKDCQWGNRQKLLFFFFFNQRPPGFCLGCHIKCLCLYVCLSHHMVSVSGKFLSPFSRTCREGEGKFREEELGLGQVFPLAKLGKEVLKQRTPFLEGLAVFKWRTQRTNPNNELSIAVKTNSHNNTTAIHCVNVLEV